MSAGRTLYKYERPKGEPTTFKKVFEYDSRPNEVAPWSYPQTGVGVVLPMHAPYDK